MTMKKRITSFALVLLMVLSSLAMLLPVTGVKAAAVGETKTYIKVTEAPEEGSDWSGTYLIVYEKSKTEGYAFNGVDASKGGSYKSLTIADNKIVTNDSEIVEFVIEVSGSGYSILISGGANKGKYLAKAQDKNGIDFSPNAAVNSINIDANGVNIIGSGKARLRFNAGTNDDRFRYYKSTTYTAQQPIQLYKLDTSSTPTEPDVPVHEGDHTYGEWTSDNNTTHSHQCTIGGCKATETANHEIITWTSLNANKHTGKCKDCGYTTEGAHEWVTDTEATNVPDGKLAQKCRVCGEKQTVDKPNEPETIDFSTKGYNNAEDVAKVEQNGFIINLVNSKYYTSGTAIRVYTGGTITVVAPAGKLITGIVFEFTEKKYSNISADGYSGTTWTGTAQSVTFSSETAQSRIKTISITTIDAPKFEYATLDVKENIDVNFYVSVPNGYDVANLKMLFNFHRADTSVGGELVTTESGIAYRFTLKDVAPHLMGENITATLKNGDTVIATLEYSINTYLDNQKKDTTLSDSTKALIESIAAYGDKAADYDSKRNDDTTFTGTVTENPADMTESTPTIGTTLEGFRFKGVAVRMENNIRIRVSFENTSGAELKFFVKVGDGEETEAILSNGYVYTDLIAPSAYDTEYTIIAKNTDGETVGTVSLSVNTYVYMVLKAFPANGQLTNAQAAMRELAIAIYNYGKAAKTAIGA